MNIHSSNHTRFKSNFLKHSAIIYFLPSLVASTIENQIWKLYFLLRGLCIPVQVFFSSITFQSTQMLADTYTLDKIFTFLRVPLLWFSWLVFVLGRHNPWWQTRGFPLAESSLGVSHRVWWRGRISAEASRRGKILVQALYIPPSHPLVLLCFFSDSNRKSVI